ncbi:P44/Msp2 family outer membrane protein [Mesorhizobium sp. M2A.F.Ca.ET.037.01.1.1]|uniref:outer membrane protein n=1 Tax=unclassified Mesorhizobium TaxID=325217 RepID=UPI000F74DAD4|nr:MULTISPECIES: outer membrane protein [unclassified Mesorhizobium]RUY11133.1 P44/Msp2 family outer membrane protein [Mesorhizobium sp. M2A.F.Ca.ET.040.01.1.1]RVC69107.1 P44/Msp2 family outer membrane protein [Mesorhizobium sp. M00.F.Ca.ET.038.03.1.1]RVC78302.1 P44/Msp2 family outer membrane protein [Mesorhizobium sp. M2A.F.Ca.ET.046.02.1.1]AZO36215.1 porin family protein [Mesorhizobium sp. M2A.F.Ca.ET.046.03.2.1]RUX17527.1 P44/Msp2 family outer membrane protein [Mesorhizobium sp. M2A.F.Ca.ET
MTSRSRIASALAATILLPMTPALAADYDPPIYVDQAPDYQPVEVGSGWYLRGDVAYLPQETFDNGDFTFPSAIDNESFSEGEDAYFASIGFGYHFNDYLRADLNLGYLPGNHVSVSYDDSAVAPAGTAILGSGNVKNYAFSGILNGYVDLGTYVGITPYVGAGIGLVRTTSKLSASYTDSADSSNDFVLSSNKNQYSLAYTLNAGLAYQVTKNVLVDLGYQYFSAPNAEYVAAESLTSYPTRKGISNHQIKFGLRYDLW